MTAIAGGTAVITATSQVKPSVTGSAIITVDAGVDLTPLFGTFNISATKTTDTGTTTRSPAPSATAARRSAGTRR